MKKPAAAAALAGDFESSLASATSVLAQDPGGQGGLDCRGDGPPESGSVLLGPGPGCAHKGLCSWLTPGGLSLSRGPLGLSGCFSLGDATAQGTLPAAQPLPRLPALPWPQGQACRLHSPQQGLESGKSSWPHRSSWTRPGASCTRLSAAAGTLPPAEVRGEDSAPTPPACHSLAEPLLLWLAEGQRQQARPRGQRHPREQRAPEGPGAGGLRGLGAGRPHAALSPGGKQEPGAGAALQGHGGTPATQGQGWGSPWRTGPVEGSERGQQVESRGMRCGVQVGTAGHSGRRAPGRWGTGSRKAELAGGRAVSDGLAPTQVQVLQEGLGKS